MHSLHFLLTILIFLFCNQHSFSQSNNSEKYDLLIIKKTADLKKQVNLNAQNEMIDLGKVLPQIVYDLKYATSDNFMKEKLYPSIKTTFLRKPAADALEEVMKDLKKENLGIKIWDAYRPFSITEMMWEKIHDPRYVADPAQGSGHNRGIAVDLTLIDLNTKKEIPMPTGFDNFSDTAHRDFMNLSPEILKNRKILRTVMEKHGFIALETEWWHFYLPNSTNYEVLDLSFKQLRKLTR